MKKIVAAFIITVISAAQTFAGGIIFYTSGGSPYVNVVQYETYTAPSAHLSYITVKGGQKTQIQSAGIIANIPLPTTGTEYSLEDIQTNIAQADAMASRQPKFAQAMQKVSQLWNDQIPAAEALQKRRLAEEAAAKKKAEENKQLVQIDGNKSAPAAKEPSPEHQKSTIEVNLAAPGSAFPTANTINGDSEEAAAKTAAEASQKRRLAEEAADKKKTAEDAEKTRIAKEGNDKRFAAKVEEAINNPPDFTITPRGPAIHGFQLGMLYSDFLTNLKRFSNEEFKLSLSMREDVTDLAGQTLYSGQNRLRLQYVAFSIGYGESVDVGIAGKPAVVIGITFHAGMLQKLFKSKDMDFKSFTQQFIDGYKIPSLEGYTKGDYQILKYTSPDGWEIAIEQERYGRDLHLRAIPTKESRGFGQ